jgi:hypothetical protein
VRQETKWPDSDTASFTFTCAQPQEFELRLRHPHWARQGITVKVNGKVSKAGSQPSSYLTLKRQWKTGDRVEIRMPMSLRTEAMPDNPNRIAVFYGPTLLAANLGEVRDPEAAKPLYVPVLVTDGKPITEWLKPVSLAAQTFKTVNTGKPREVEFNPFHRLHDRRYSVYLDVYRQEDWAKREADLRAQQEREAKLAARTLDVLRIGEMQPERDHHLMSDRSTVGEHLTRKWRDARDGGWMAFELMADPEKANELLCTYWGGETGQRKFDILVEGTKVATQTLLNNQPGQFFDVAYPIPVELTKGKEKVTVKIQALPGNWAGGLFGARMLKR